MSERPDTAWVATLSPWPKDGFGLERMQALLERLGHPERAFDAIHVVGTKGKSTATRTIAALLASEGLRTGAYTSPHVAGWWERLDTDAAGFETAIARVRPAAEALDATQFELLTAAAFADFAARGVEVAAVEAGLGGRLDATNVLGARVVLLTNVGLEHTEILGAHAPGDRAGEARGGGSRGGRGAPRRRIRAAARRTTTSGWAEPARRPRCISAARSTTMSRCTWPDDSR